MFLHRDSIVIPPHLWSGQNNVHDYYHYYFITQYSAATNNIGQKYNGPE